MDDGCARKLLSPLSQQNRRAHMMNRVTLITAALLVLGAAPFARAQQPASAATEKGEYLARAGDCVACHSVPGGKAFAGGLRMGTPMGAIYSTNITPDKETGIGNYSFDDFDRALRSGVARDGHRLYPAMPYPSYAKIADDDLHALYEFFMKKVPPVRQANKPSEIPGYLSFRWPLAIWNLLFTESGSYVAKPGHDAAWNRGAYLIEGLGHCGACHTPRGWAFQEKALDGGRSSYLQGAELDAWSAPNLRQDVRTGLGGWSVAEIAAFLKTGHNEKGVAFGSMLDVVNNSTPYLSNDDLNAMATYLKSLSPTAAQTAPIYDESTTKALLSGSAKQPGATLYLGHCVSCHGADGKGQGVYIPPLAGNPVLLDPNPTSLINLVLNGSQTIVVKGTPDSYRMPQYRAQLSDEEISEVLSFVRGAWGNEVTGVTANQVKTLRPITDPSSDQVILLKMR
jgi:mono/diheme cytochrome c family protein